MLARVSVEAWVLQLTAKLRTRRAGQLKNSSAFSSARTIRVSVAGTCLRKTSVFRVLRTVVRPLLSACFMMNGCCTRVRQIVCLAAVLFFWCSCVHERDSESNSVRCLVCGTRFGSLQAKKLSLLLSLAGSCPGLSKQLLT